MSVLSESIRAHAVALLKVAEEMEREETPDPRMFEDVWAHISLDGETYTEAIARNALKNAGITTLGQLVASDPFKISNCGRKTTSRLHDALTRIGVTPAWRRP